MRTLILLTLLCACSGTSPADTGPCTQRSGTYRVTFAERPGGDCGPLPEQVIPNAGPPTVPMGCTGTSVASSDNCSVTLDLTCPSTDGVSIHDRGIVHFVHDASGGTGSLQVIATDATGHNVCSETYDVVWAKQ